MKFVIAGVGVLIAAGIFLYAAYLSFATSAGDTSTWGWRVFRKLRIIELKDASRRRADEREARRKNKNQN